MVVSSLVGSSMKGSAELVGQVPQLGAPQLQQRPHERMSLRADPAETGRAGAAQQVADDGLGGVVGVMTHDDLLASRCSDESIEPGGTGRCLPGRPGSRGHCDHLERKPDVLRNGSGRAIRARARPPNRG